MKPYLKNPGSTKACFSIIPANFTHPCISIATLEAMRFDHCFLGSGDSPGPWAFFNVRANEAASRWCLSGS